MGYDSFVDWMVGRRDRSGTRIKPGAMRGMGNFAANWKKREYSRN